SPGEGAAVVISASGSAGHRWQGRPVDLHLVGRRHHGGGTVNHLLAFLIDYPGSDADPVLRQLLQDFQLDADVIAQAYRAQEAQFLTDIDAARTWQLAGDVRGDEGAGQHAVGDRPLEWGGGAKFLIQMHRVNIPRDSGEQDQVPLADQMSDTGRIADGQLFIGTVFQHRHRLDSI